MNAAVALGISIGVGVAASSGAYYINNSVTKNRTSLLIPYNSASLPSIKNKNHVSAVNEIIETCEKKCVEIKNNDDGSCTLNIVPQ